MTVRVTMRVEGAPMGEIVRSFRGMLAQDITLGVDAATDGALMEMRQEIARAFPRSRRLPTVLTASTEPLDSQKKFSLSAAGRIYGRGGKRSSWPAPLWALTFGAEIKAKDGALAIPTDRVPRNERRMKMTPAEVEARYAQKLAYVPAGRMGKVPALVLNNVTIGRSGRVRQATAGRARQGRTAKPVVMFWLVPQVRLPTRWNPREIMARWASLAPDLVERARAARDAEQQAERDFGNPYRRSAAAPAAPPAAQSSNGWGPVTRSPSNWMQRR